MNKIKKILSIVLVITLSFLAFTSNVKALRFDNGDFVCYNRETFNLSSNCSTESKIKYVWNTNQSEFAYCATRNYSFLSGSQEYVELTEWLNKNDCTYYVGGVRNDSNHSYSSVPASKGNCSKILGFIIKKSLEKFKDESKTQKWIHTQGAVWTYLRYHSIPPYNAQNINSIFTLWKNTPWNINVAIHEGWAAYHASVNGNPAVDKTDSNVNFSVDYKNGPVTFNFVPSGNSCDTTGYYVTQNITITNNEKDMDITVTVAKQSGFKICESGGTCYNTDFKRELAKNGGKVVIYLRSEKDVSNLGSLAALEIKGEYQTDPAADVPTYMTRMYYPYYVDGGRKIEKTGQRLLIMSEESKSTTYHNFHIKKVDVPLKQNLITHKVCSVTEEAKYRNLGYNMEVKENDPISKVCASNIPASERANTSNKSKYITQFYGCKCHPVNLDKNNSIGILLTERVFFRFGSFETENAYPGGGFGLSSGALSTKYTAVMLWDYANVDANGNPYYYDSKNAVGHVETDNATLREKIRNYLDGLKQIDGLDVETINSNDQSKGKANAKIDIYYDPDDPDDLDSHTDAEKRLNVKDNVMVMKKAYFSSKGLVSYGNKDSVYKVDGGNKYYIPMNYTGKSFPYNIKVNNLSLSGLFDFYYKADCGIGVQEYKYGVTYRTIDVSDPFVRTNNIASAVNWSDWWNGNVPNQTRVHSTFSSYPNYPTYRVTLDSNLIQKYVNYDLSYTNWNTVQADGSNEFVVGSNGFNTVAKGGNTGSYCEIGRFSSSCDR